MPLSTAYRKNANNASQHRLTNFSSDVRWAVLNVNFFLSSQHSPVHDDDDTTTTQLYADFDFLLRSTIARSL